MHSDFEIVTDYQGRAIRLTQERWAHILAHPEMAGEHERMVETLMAPHLVVATESDKTVYAYQRLYEQTPVSRKYLAVIVKTLESDAFILTAFFTSRIKKGTVIWQP